jgi:hypothetical protein
MMKRLSSWLLAALLLAASSPVDASPRAVGVPRATDGRIREEESEEECDSCSNPFLLRSEFTVTHHTRCVAQAF